MKFNIEKNCLFCKNILIKTPISFYKECYECKIHITYNETFLKITNLTGINRKYTIYYYHSIKLIRVLKNDSDRGLLIEQRLNNNLTYKVLLKKS